MIYWQTGGKISSEQKLLPNVGRDGVAARMIERSFVDLCVYVIVKFSYSAGVTQMTSN